MMDIKITDIIKQFSQGSIYSDERICLQSPAEMQFVYDIGNSIKNGLIVEIGRWRGGSLAILCLSSPSSKVISLDSMRLYDERTIKLLDELYIDPSRYQLMVGSSQIICSWKEGLIDLLFIDGCHEMNSVYKDLELWVPRMKKNGLLLMHDMSNRKKHNGPRRAFNKYLNVYKNLKLVKPAGFLWLIEKI